MTGLRHQQGKFWFFLSKVNSWALKFADIGMREMK